MGAQNLAFLSFNRGLISDLGLGRLDVARTRLSADEFSNWMPRVLGSMSIRPGLGYLGSTYNDAAARFLPFVFSYSDVAAIEITSQIMRVWVSDALITRGTVTAAVTNGGFDSNVTGWTDNDESGAVSAWVAGGYLGLTGTGLVRAIRDQTVTVNQPNTEHALRVVINRGPVTFMVGTSAGNDSYITETTLNTGAHSLAFTPTGNFAIRFSSSLKREVLVDSCTVEAAGVMTLPCPWSSADSLKRIRHDQSGDVVFVSCKDFTQRRIERRATRSWSVVQYLPEDGPFEVENSGPITLRPGDLSGNTLLFASAPFFRSTHGPSANNAGALFRVTSNGQQVTQTATGENQFTSFIRVTNVGVARDVAITITGLTATGSTVTLQRSLESENGAWSDITNYTVDTTATYNDTLDNVIAWYRIGVKTGNYVAGTIALRLNYALGSIDGICRVQVFTTTTQVTVEVLKDFGSTSASAFWSEGSWSDKKGWPSAVAFHDGRLWWAGKDKQWGSISDDFSSFDDTFVGDAGPLARSIGAGPVDNINWLLSLSRLMVGGEGAEYSARSSSLDEPITPTNFSIKSSTTRGTAAVNPLKMDTTGMFVQAGGSRVYELNLANDRNAVDYGVVDLTQLMPEIGEPGIVRSAFQRQPDPRAHFVRSDGTVALLTVDRTENVICWTEIETDGLIEDVLVLPSGAEDAVYYVVNRTINGSTKRFYERFALQSECVGGAKCALADSFVYYNGAATTNIPVAHLEGEQVVVWANGADVGTVTSTGDSWTFEHTVSGGVITLAMAATQVIVGLPYRARWRSSKLGINAALGSSLSMPKKINELALLLKNAHTRGLLFGPSFTVLDALPLVRDGKVITTDSVVEEIDDPANVFPGQWGPDSRLCLEARAPRPVTVLAVGAGTEMNERA